METPIADIDIINSEIAKLRQADIEFGEPSSCIDVLTNFPPSSEEFKIDVRRASSNDTNACNLSVVSPYKLDPSVNIDAEETVEPLALSLALNRKIKLKATICLKNIQIALEQNKQQQEHLRSTFNDDDFGATMAHKRRNISLFGRPYFRDIEGSFPKHNSETLKINSNQEIDVFTRPSKPWTIENKDDLLKSVKADFLQRKLRPLMNREQIELEKLNNAPDGSKEKKKSEEALKSIEHAMNEISNSGDLLYGTLDEVDDIDWMKIANIDMKEQRTMESCRSFWKNIAHPLINKSKWTKEEDDKLVELANQFKGTRWDRVAELLGTGRSAFICLHRYQSTFNPMIQTKWSWHEDKKLENVILKVMKGDGKINWRRVSRFFKTKSPSECEYRWNKVKDKILNRTKWTAELDHKLYESVKVFGNNWMKVAKYVPGKTSSQCADRYKNKLKDSLKTGFWSREEDAQLWIAVKQHGLDGKWSKIANDFLPHRSDNQILLRYRRLQLYEKMEKKLKGKEDSKDDEMNESNQNMEIAKDSQKLVIPKRPKCFGPKPKGPGKRKPDELSYWGRHGSKIKKTNDYALRKREHEASYNLDIDHVFSEAEDEEEVTNSPKRPRLEDKYSDPEVDAAETLRNKRPTKVCPLNERIVELLAKGFRKRNFMDKYRQKQKSKPGFKEELESKFVDLLGKALKLPITNQDLLNHANVPLLPPNRSSIQAFAKLMDDRKELVNIAGMFQFPKCIKLPKPWNRTEVEKYVETSRTFGNLVPGEKTLNSELGMLMFNKERATEEDMEIINNIKDKTQKIDKDGPDQVITKHNQASRVCRHVKSNEEYQKLQLKFTSLFFWPLLLHYSPEE